MDAKPPEREFELPEIGVKALEYMETLVDEQAAATEEEEEEEKTSEGPVASVTDMAKILERQAAKTHEAPPQRPVIPKKDDGVKEGDDKKKAPPQPQKQMIIGLSGTYAGNAAAMAKSSSSKKGTKKQQNVDKAGNKNELLEFLDESIREYEKFVNNIGRNGLAAVNVGYYRDDIQDMLDLLKYDQNMDLKPYWVRIVKIDMMLRGKAPIYVREVGYNNFKQYQIINDPPLFRWWWYLNRNVSAPMEQPKFWEIWKKI